jgi:hypothetical protein
MPMMSGFTGLRRKGSIAGDDAQASLQIEACVLSRYCIGALKDEMGDGRWEVSASPVAFVVRKSAKSRQSMRSGARDRHWRGLESGYRSPTQYPNQPRAFSKRPAPRSGPRGVCPWGCASGYYQCPGYGEPPPGQRTVGSYPRHERLSRHAGAAARFTGSDARWGGDPGGGNPSSSR